MCTKTVVDQKVGDRFAHFVRTVSLALAITKKTALYQSGRKAVFMH